MDNVSQLQTSHTAAYRSGFEAGQKQRASVGPVTDSATRALCRVLDITAEGELRRAQLAPFASVLAAMIAAEMQLRAAKNPADRAGPLV
jgi:hypothetical protein